MLVLLNFCETIETSDESILDQSFIEKYGVLFENMDTNKKFVYRIYYSCFIFFRIIYSVLLITLLEHYIFQLILIILIVALPVSFIKY